MVFFWTPNSYSFVHMPVLMPVLHCHDYCSFVVGFEILKCESSNFVLFQYCFDYSGSIEILYEFEDQLFHFCKKGHWNFDRDYTEFVDHFGWYWYLNNIKSLWWLILCVSLTRSGGAQTFSQTLFWVCLQGCFWMRLAFELVGWIKLIALPSVCGPYPFSWKPE